MIKRTFYFGNACELSKHNNQLVVDYGQDETFNRQASFEDIGLMVVDHYQVKFSTALIRWIGRKLPNSQQKLKKGKPNIKADFP